jgi:preprotein translocase subunit YajC
VLGNMLTHTPHVAVVAQQQPNGGNQLLSFLPMLVIFGLIFDFLIIRPQRTRQRKMMEMQSALTPGQRVMTVAGLYATVAAIEDDAIVLEIAPGVECRYTKQAISQVLDTGDSSDGDDAAEGADDTERADESDEGKDTDAGKATAEGESSKSSSSTAEGKSSA